MTHGGRREKLRAQLALVSEAKRQLEQRLAAEEADHPTHVRNPDRPQLRLIRGGKSLVLAPVAWAWTQVRDHAAAAVPLAATGVIGTAATLGVAAPPEIWPDPEPTSITRIDPCNSYAEAAPNCSVRITPHPQPSPSTTVTPTPAPTTDVGTSVSTSNKTAEVLGLPTLTPTPLPEMVEPVEMWTRAAAVAHCRDVLLTLDLRGCVEELLAN